MKKLAIHHCIYIAPQLMGARQNFRRGGSPKKGAKRSPPGEKLACLKQFVDKFLRYLFVKIAILEKITSNSDGMQCTTFNEATFSCTLVFVFGYLM